MIVSSVGHSYKPMSLIKTYLHSQMESDEPTADDQAEYEASYYDEIYDSPDNSSSNEALADQILAIAGRHDGQTARAIVQIALADYLDRLDQESLTRIRNYADKWLD